MPIRFAAARSTACSPIARALARKALARAANDNFAGNEDGGVSHDNLLRAALRHFAEHGLGAAREARKQAEQAFAAGDAQAYDWWLGVCRALDRRLAAQMPPDIGDSAAV